MRTWGMRTGLPNYPLTSTRGATQEGREPVGNGQAAAGFSDDFRPGVAAVEG